jgi:hypothetical protein
MHGWFVWEHEVWMTIAWLTVVGLFITLIWSIVLSATLRFQKQKPSETHASGDDDTHTREHDAEMAKAA